MKAVDDAETSGLTRAATASAGAVDVSVPVDPAIVQVTAKAQGSPWMLLGVVTGSHLLVDVYAAIVPPIVGVLQVRTGSTAAQVAWLSGLGSLASGLCQPVLAWVSDRTDSRIYIGLGLALAAVCLSSIGMAESFAAVMVLYAIGSLASGMYHPVAAATMGQLARRLPGNRHALGVSVFHLAGMIGGILGLFFVPRLVTREGGFNWLLWAMIPGVLMAVVAHAYLRRVSHRHHVKHVSHLSRAEMSRRWKLVAVLYVANAMRFTVNTALYYLFVRWAESVVTAEHAAFTVEQVAEAAAPRAGNLNAMMAVGMAVGGIGTTAVIRHGREKWPLVLVPIGFAPLLVLFPLVGLTGGCVLALLAGIGFAGVIPVSISLAQRLLPHRTSLASGLMMGGAWAVAFIGPGAAEWCLGVLRLGLPLTFGLTAALLAVSGLVSLALDSVMLKQSA